MKSLLSIRNTPRLLALVLGFFLFWPGARAICDGDGVDILPFIDDGGGQDDASAPDGGGFHQPAVGAGILYGWRVGDGFRQPVLSKQFPAGTSRISWQRVAASISHNWRLRGLRFMVGYMSPDANGQLVFLFAIVDGGDGKPVKFRRAVLR